MKQNTEKQNLTSESVETVETSGSIRIEDSCEIYAERLELCVLRSGSFDAEKPDPAWAGFLSQCLSVLEGMRSEIQRGDKICQSNGNAEQILCKPAEGADNNELCKLQGFWLTELSALSKVVGSLDETKKLTAIVPAWETTLQILLEAECAKAENVPVNEKEVRNILYSYLYDYAEDILALASSGCFLPAFLAGEDTPHVGNGLSLFFGDRLKSRLLDILEKQQEGTLLQPTGTLLQPTGTLLQPTGNVPPCRKQPRGNVPPCRNLTAHQEKALAEFWKKAALLMSVVLLAMALAACGGEKSGEEDSAGTQLTEQDENAYPGTVAYEDGELEVNDKFGIMHATVLDVQNGEKDGLFIYSLRDQEDPDNAWCLNSQDVGSIVCDVTGGKEVAVLFSGDIVNDPDSVEFIAILNDAPYTIKQTTGSTVSNMMNSFTVRTDKGVELTFVKDNCKVDKDALSTEDGARLRIFYTDGGSVDHYPLRVYKLPSNER